MVFELAELWKSLPCDLSDFASRSVFSKWLKMKKESYFGHNFHVFWPLETADLSIWGRIQPEIHFWYWQSPPTAVAGDNAFFTE